jgi:hypothetical protein
LGGAAFCFAAGFAGADLPLTGVAGLAGFAVFAAGAGFFTGFFAAGFGAGFFGFALAIGLAVVFFAISGSLRFLLGFLLGFLHRRCFERTCKYALIQPIFRKRARYQITGGSAISKPPPTR